MSLDSGLKGVRETESDCVRARWDRPDGCRLPDSGDNHDATKAARSRCQGSEEGLGLGIIRQTGTEGDAEMSGKHGSQIGGCQLPRLPELTWKRGSRCR